MPIVPFRQPQPTTTPKLEVEDTYLAMAAAGMHEADCLFEPSPTTTSPDISIRNTYPNVSRKHPDFKRQRDEYETWKGIGIENESVRLPPLDER